MRIICVLEQLMNSHKFCLRNLAKGVYLILSQQDLIQAMNRTMLCSSNRKQIKIIFILRYLAKLKNKRICSSSKTGKIKILLLKRGNNICSRLVNNAKSNHLMFTFIIKINTICPISKAKNQIFR